MNAKDMQTEVERIHARCVDLLKVKGEEYSGQGDTLARFKIVGAMLHHALKAAGYDIPERVCAGIVLMVGHLKAASALMAYFAKWTEGAEGINGRVADAVNYGFLAGCLVADLQETPDA